MAFVHGHARDNGWVVAHVRAPVDAEDGQLPLDPDPGEPGEVAEVTDPAEPAPAAPAPEAGR
jgi:hypothetical protein